MDSEEHPSATEDENETVEDLDNRVVNSYQGSLTETGDLVGPDVSSTSASAIAGRLSWEPQTVLLFLLIPLILS